MSFRKSILGLIAIAAVSVPATAQTDDMKCQIYAKTGGTMADYMLPLRLQDLVNMLSGKDTELMSGLTGALVGKLTPQEMAAMAQFKSNDATILGEAAGEVTMALLMGGQATSGAQVQSILKDTCMQVGPDQIIQNQRRAKAISDKNLGN